MMYGEIAFAIQVYTGYWLVLIRFNMMYGEIVFSITILYWILVGTNKIQYDVWIYRVCNAILHWILNMMYGEIASSITILYWILVGNIKNQYDVWRNHVFYYNSVLDIGW